MMGKIWKWCLSSTLHHSFLLKSELDLIMMMQMMMTMVASYKSLSPLPSLSERTGLIIPVGHFHLPSLPLLSHPPLLRLWGSPTSFYFSALLFWPRPPRPAQSHFCGYFSTTVDSFSWVVKLSGEWSIITHKCNIVPCLSSWTNYTSYVLKNRCVEHCKVMVVSRVV